MAARTSKTTFAKLDRERRRREKREEKRARRDARRAEAANTEYNPIAEPELLDSTADADEALDPVES